MTGQYHLPAEWHPQRAVMLTWPHAGSDWAARLPQVETTYLELATRIGARQALLLLFDAEQTRERILESLIGQGVPSQHILSRVVESDDTWTRDHGPITLVNESGGACIKDFTFNGWGNKFSSERDNRITRTLSAAGCFADTPCVSVDLVLEGGAIETDGRGTLLALRRTLEDPARNPSRSLAEIEAILRRELAIERFLWLEHGQLTGDDTDGHIDTLVRFCNPTTLVYATANPEDPDYPGLRAMEEELQALRTAEGQPYHLVPLPPLRPVFDEDGKRLPAGYANFLIINGAVLLPVYGLPSDDQAQSVIQECFPEREIVPVNCRELIRQNGSLHCITMQLPTELPLDCPAT